MASNRCKVGFTSVTKILYMFDLTSEKHKKIFFFSSEVYFFQLHCVFQEGKKKKHSRMFCKNTTHLLLSTVNWS